MGKIQSRSCLHCKVYDWIDRIKLLDEIEKASVDDELVSLVDSMYRVTDPKVSLLAFLSNWVASTVKVKQDYVFCIRFAIFTR